MGHGDRTRRMWISQGGGQGGGRGGGRTGGGGREGEDGGGGVGSVSHPLV